MRPRPLQEDSAVIRSTGFADLSVTASTVFKTAAQAPAAGGLLSNHGKLRVAFLRTLRKKSVKLRESSNVNVICVKLLCKIIRL